MTARRVRLPAPTGGWDTTTPIEIMPPDRAVVMDNMIPQPWGLERRGGFTTCQTDGLVDRHLTRGAGSSPARGISLIHEFNNGTQRHMILGGSATLRAMSGSSDPIKFSHIASASVGAGGNYFVATNFKETSIIVNGYMAPAVYDGTKFSAMYISATATTTASAFNYVHEFKGRLLFAKKDSQSFFYLPLAARAGKVQEFPLGEVANIGGQLEIITSWTRDGGDGPDDYAVFIYDTGEVLVYQGSDPSSITDWALVGRYKIGKPLAKNAHVQVGGNIIVMTDNDFVRIPDDVQTGFPPPTTLSGAAKWAGNKYPKTKEFSATEDVNYWNAVTYPKEALLIYNIPIRGASAEETEQYVVNMRTGAACRWNTKQTKPRWARTWGVFNDNLYMTRGDEERLYFYSSANYPFAGFDPGSTTPDYRVMHSFSDLGTTDIKQVTAYRTKIVTGASTNCRTMILYDFRTAFGTDGQNTVIRGTGAGTNQPPWDGNVVSAHPEWQKWDGGGQYVSFQWICSANAGVLDYRYTEIEVVTGTGFI